MKNQLIIDHISKLTDTGDPILSDISFSLPKGSRLSVLGPSGSGKTTLLRVISGLEKPDSGRILFNDRVMNDTPPHRRNFGLMFQEFALFPHLDVFGNIAFGLNMRGIEKSGVDSRVNEMLDLTGLEKLKHRKIDELSGGERQRVALARTLAPNPELLMLDEPLSSLDRVLRKRLLKELTQIISTLNITTIFVTHDHEEAFTAGHTIMILNNGRIEQTGTSNELKNNSKNEWVKNFLK